MAAAGGGGSGGGDGIGSGASGRGGDERPLVLVVGAGVTGLSVALALVEAGAGARIEVHERRSRAKALSGAGGLLVQENAVRALHALPGSGGAVAGALAAAGRAVGRGGFVSRTGRALFCSDARARAAHGPAAPGFALARAALQRALFDAVRTAAARADVPLAFRFGSKLVALDPASPAPTAAFADGSVVRAAAVIAADGAHSRAREAVAFGPAPPRYSGQAVWIGVAPESLVQEAAPAVRGMGLVEFWGERASRFGYFAAGPAQLCWYAMARAPRGGRDPDGPRKALLQEFCSKGYEFPAVVRAILENMDESMVVRHDVCDRDPPGERWGSGAVTLVGDAAHPMYPSIGQGACLGIEDAVALAAVLAPALRNGDPIPPVLRSFERDRTPRVRRMVRMGRLVARTASLTNPISCWIRDFIMSLLPQRVLEAQFSWMYSEFEPPVFT